MSNSQAAVVGAGGILTVGGRTFVVQKPSARDLVLMQKWIMAQPLKNGGGLSPEDFKGLTAEQQALLIREYAKTAKGKRTPSEAEVLELACSPAGVAMQLWLAARHADPSLRQEDIRALVAEENVADVIVSLDEACKAPGPDGDDGDPKAPAGTTSSSPT